MKNNVYQLLSFKTRFVLYILSLTSLVFLQTYCTNVCPFIDGLANKQIYRNLGFIFILHLCYREFLYYFFKKPWKNISIPRQAYFLSIISWCMAGISAFALHAYLYPNFPIDSHIKLLSSYIALGGGILAQIEYIVFEKEYKNISKNQTFTVFSEKISQRIIETFLIFTFVPILTLLLTISRYNFDGTIDLKVTIEMLFMGVFMLIAVFYLSIYFCKSS